MLPMISSRRTGKGAGRPRPLPGRDGLWPRQTVASQRWGCPSRPHLQNKARKFVHVFLDDSCYHGVTYSQNGPESSKTILLRCAHPFILRATTKSSAVFEYHDWSCKAHWHIQNRTKCFVLKFLFSTKIAICHLITSLQEQRNLPDLQRQTSYILSLFSARISS